MARVASTIMSIRGERVARWERVAGGGLLEGLLRFDENSWTAMDLPTTQEVSSGIQ
jgi:hypothetical protein